MKINAKIHKNHIYKKNEFCSISTSRASYFINEIHQLMTNWQGLLFAIQKSFDITWKQILNFEENVSPQSESQLLSFNVLDRNKDRE